MSSKERLIIEMQRNENPVVTYMASNFKGKNATTEEPAVKRVFEGEATFSFFRYSAGEEGGGGK